MPTSNRFELTVILGLLALVVAVVIGGVVVAQQDRAARAEPPTTHQAPRVCFPRDEWGANPAQRPCARIVRLYEDGSFKARVSDADGTIRYSLGVGNPQD